MFFNHYIHLLKFNVTIQATTLNSKHTRVDRLPAHNPYGAYWYNDFAVEIIFLREYLGYFRRKN